MKYPYRKYLNKNEFIAYYKFGYVKINKLKSYSYIRIIYVYNRYRSKGHSHTILNYVTNWADKYKYRLKLRVDPSDYSMLGINGDHHTLTS